MVGAAYSRYALEKPHTSPGTRATLSARSGLPADNANPIEEA